MRKPKVGDRIRLKYNGAEATIKEVFPDSDWVHVGAGLQTESTHPTMFDFLEEECESKMYQGEISQAIKNWLSTLPTKD